MTEQETAVLTWGLYTSLSLCLAGLLYKAVTWHRLRFSPDASAETGTSEPGAAGRFLASLRGTLGALFSRRLPSMLAGLVLDVLLQRRLLAADPVRWFCHLGVLYAFTALLLFHALGRLLGEALFESYYSTLNPFLWMRDLLGLVVLLGMVGLLLRRGQARRSHPSLAASARSGRLFTGVLAAVMLSGFALNAVKITSATRFYEMTEEYLGTTEDEEILPLKLLWAAEYGVVFDGLSVQPEANLSQGRELNQDACASCHSRPGAALASYPLSRVLAPAARGLDQLRADRALYWLHVAICLLGLAALPFFRLSHAVADPISLLASKGARAHGPRGADDDGEGAAPGSGAVGPSEADAARAEANQATRRALGLDACVRCGLCDARCSVEPYLRVVDNNQVLPSRRLQAMRSAVTHGAAAGQTLQDVVDGAHVCTLCGRCTERCPAGIDLQDLWRASRAHLAGRGLRTGHAWIAQRDAVQWAERLMEAVDGLPRTTEVLSTNLSDDRTSFTSCVQCQTCANVCPVVAASHDPACGVDMTPQKVMNLLRLGMREMALGSRMVWDCVTCYQCQEHCPESIRVADILFELRNLAYHQLRAIDPHPSGGERDSGEDGDEATKTPSRPPPEEASS